MASADIILVADLDVSRVNKKLNSITANTNQKATQAGQSFSKLSKGQRQEVRQLGFALQRMGLQGTAAFGEIFVALGPAGIAIGALIVSVLALIKVMKSLATAAVNAFKTVTSQAVEAAKEYEIAGAQFKAVMKGNEQAAEATLNRVRELSRQVGQNLTGVARAFLPEVESLDQLEDILKIATALAQYQPEQGILGARIALQEFLSGETRSLRRRFEIPQTDIDRMKEAFETGGIQAAIDELNGFLAATGRSLEDLSDTATVAFNRMREGWRQLAAAYGEPIIKAAKQEANELNSVFAKLRPILDAIAEAFGKVVGRVVELIGSEVQSFIDGLDFGVFFELATAFDGLVTGFSIFIDMLNPGAQAAAGFNDIAHRLAGALLRLEGNFLRLAQAVADARLLFGLWADDMGKAEDALRFLADAMDLADATPYIGPLNEIVGGMASVAGIAKEMGEAMKDAGGDVEALDEAFKVWEATMEAWEEGDLNVVPEIDDDDFDVGEIDADEILTLDRAREQLDQFKKEYPEVQEELSKLREDFLEKDLEKQAAIQTRYDRRILAAEIRAGRRFVELETKI
jgi:hypothetical protein